MNNFFIPSTVPTFFCILFNWLLLNFGNISPDQGPVLSMHFVNVSLLCNFSPQALYQITPEISPKDFRYLSSARPGLAFHSQSSFHLTKDSEL